MDLNETARRWLFIAQELRKMAWKLEEVPEMRSLLIAKAMVYEHCAEEILPKAES